jgi:glycosyltransferase involved in cell wall biosynthesis
VVYEYANHLAERGHVVTVVHTSRAERDLSAPSYLRRSGAHAFRRLLGIHGPSRWFPLDRRVRSLWVPSLAARHVPDGDAVVATAWQTAEWVAGYPGSKGRKFYLIQHLETWAGPEDRVMATWRLPLEKIVISRWLADIAKSLGEVSRYIPNGLDFDAFGPDVPPESRRADSFLMLYHDQSWKGARDGIDALERVHDRIPGASIRLFGTGARPRDVSQRFEYHRDPSQRELRSLYNQAAIFVAPSLTEGWGLPSCEAMMSGCALAATDIGGHREFAVPGETALLSPPGDPPALADNLVRLAKDEALRLRLARAGMMYVQRFTWTRAVDAFEQALHSPA